MTAPWVVGMSRTSTGRLRLRLVLGLCNWKYQAVRTKRMAQRSVLSLTAARFLPVLPDWADLT